MNSITMVASNIRLDTQSTTVPEGGVWVFIWGDILIFSVFYLVFMLGRTEDLELFLQSSQSLNQLLGTINTLLLVTSSWLVALSVCRARTQGLSSRGVRIPLVGAMAAGIGFLVIKFYEYYEKSTQGISLVTNDFYSFYFAFTGLHVVHVGVGLGLLAFVYFSANRTKNDGTAVKSLESVGIYWHMVDLLWLWLFVLFYLVV